jgi:hypothetical protein
MFAKLIDALHFFVRMREAAVIARRRRPEEVRHLIFSA